MGAHDFTARPLTSRFAADAPWPIGSLILAVGLPQMLKSFVRRTKVPSAQLALMDFARIALGLDKDKAKRGTHTCIISGSFPLDVNKQTQQTCASPPTPNPPRSLVFMCFTRTRVSMRHVCRFYQMCCFPSASLVKAHSSLHCSSVPLYCQSHSLFPNVFISSQDPWTTSLSLPCFLIITSFYSGHPRYRVVSLPLVRASEKHRLCTAKWR
jgi:hypothetical protein